MSAIIALECPFIPFISSSPEGKAEVCQAVKHITTQSEGERETEREREGSRGKKRQSVFWSSKLVSQSEA